MTIAESREIYRAAFHRKDDLEAFCADVMPKVFKLLEAIDNGSNHWKTVQALARECRPKPLQKKEPFPGRYTGKK